MRRGAGGSRVLAVLVLAVVISAVSDDAVLEARRRAAPSAVVIWPDTVVAATGTSFALRALLKNSAGQFYDPLPGEVSWTSEDVAIAKVTTSAADARGHVKVLALATQVGILAGAVGASGVSARAVVKIVTPPVLVTADGNASLHPADLLPDAITASGWDAARCSDSSFAFAIDASLTNMWMAPGSTACRQEGALFVEGRRAFRTVVPAATAPSSPLTANPLPNPLPRTLPLALHVFVDRDVRHSDVVLSGADLATLQSNALSHLVWNLLYASDAYRTNRVGIALGWDATAADITVHDGVNACPATGAAPAWVPAEDGKLHVIVVDQLNGTTDAGVACVSPHAHVILVANWVGRVDIVAHEVGHALGLREESGQGHTNTIAGFGKLNAMWTNLVGDEPSRTHFSLGQVYRMNFDAASWIVHPNSTTPLATCASAVLTGGACPPLRHDFRPPLVP